MRFSSIWLWAGCALSVLAEDLLFIETLQDKEYDEAISMGYTAKVVTEAQWRSMTTSDFAAFKAIIISDPYCGSVDEIKFLEDTTAVWSPAVQGNIIVIGTDPSFHFGTGKAQTLIDNSINFAAAGKTSAGVPQTGLYLALSCYYNDVDSAKVDALSYFGDFTVRGNLDCYNKVHLVAHSDAMTSLDDASLSDWSCSVHEAFASYPSVGINGFQALAIADGVLGIGSQTFGDGTMGLPYIISRGATPVKCGDGIWDKSLGEECDDGNTTPGDGCSASCKCESGRPKGDGTCYPAPGGNVSTPVSGPTGYPTGYPTGGPKPSGGPYGNYSASVTPPYPYTPIYTPPPYVTPSCPTGPRIVGVEIIVEVTITESCRTIDATSTITDTVTVPCSTKERPIYDVSTSILPCYICALSSEGISCPTTEFITVSTTACPSCPASLFPAPLPPVLYTSSGCSGYTITDTAFVTPSPGAYTFSAIPYPTPVPHTHQETTTVLGGTAYMTESLIKVPTAGPTGLTTSVGTNVPVKPTTTTTGVALFTGAAGRMSVGMGGVVGAGLGVVGMVVGLVV
ncbi:hypothetical protein K432DRAFT_426610 [Lepidopterella palustris CBS 459.81]|uniref:Uncharacterized protein n=1 Tax=Lepidopterella palustris CBS 459.81 TaxID=1314670 RepID=A0A8E2JEB5_9PEZI|nr:hypothetical protein K432DRAFT_426610 [Lepidopterella palustris CBS 459.81]